MFKLLVFLLLSFVFVSTSISEEAKTRWDQTPIFRDLELAKQSHAKYGLKNVSSLSGVAPPDMFQVLPKGVNCWVKGVTEDGFIMLNVINMPGVWYTSVESFLPTERK